MLAQRKVFPEGRGRSIRLRGALMLLTLVGLLLLVPTAYASPPAPASGSFLNAGPPINEEVRMAGDNIIITGTYPYILTGTVAGSAVDEVRTVFHPNGTFTFEIVERCACTVSGQSGTMVSRLVGRGEGASYQGELTMISGTGGLANLHYHATFAGTVGVGGSYTGQIHFDP